MTLPELPAELHSLLTIYPCRQTQFTSLFSLLGHDHLPSPPSICLAGFPCTGKRTVTRAFLEATGIKHAWIDCAETISSALLFYRIISALTRMTGQTGETARIGGDVNSFVVEVQKAMGKLQGKIVLVPCPSFFLLSKPILCFKD